MFDWLIDKSQLIIIIGGIITIIGTWLASKKNDKDASLIASKAAAHVDISNRNLQLTNENKSLTEINLSLTGQNLDYAKKQKELSDENIKLSNELIKNAKANFDYTTGAGSFCQMVLLFDKIFEPKIVWKHKGINPIRGATVGIKNINTPIRSLDDYLTGFQAVPDLYKGEQAADRNRLQINPLDKNIDYRLFFFISGRKIIQEIHLEFNGSRWVGFTKIKEGEKVLLTETIN
ncbi:MAG: hypothetical protein J0H29_02180 [Sphingobacteriales bacterium]|uniref:hypothetical protein n=1 Tax=uncultured Dysgonomonas sp. TaxID=206096 RepID=UPI00095EBC0B|nr:hypothetical protein [uncultured Dysgonomonas sp.]MBN8857164.1 hypothetical protein [Sphingobacteriales bacterium]OJY87998.1 MAG: hypothetical protein BGP14_21390 [Sphingobacteriales bacterium 44-15]